MSGARRVGIVQSSYIPWRGTFAMMARCEICVFLDSVQFTRRDWRTRNRIKTPQGPIWITVPVKQKGNYLQSIDRMEVADPGWAARHLSIIENAYRRADGFLEGIAPLRDAYAGIADVAMLSAINQQLIGAICAMLDVTPRFVRDIDLISREALDAMSATDRLVALAAALGATHYMSGPSARSYLDETVFAARGIAVEWMAYDGLQAYLQLWGPFEPAVSIVDTLLTLGPGLAREALHL